MEKPDWFLIHEQEDRKYFTDRPTHAQMELLVERVVSKVLLDFFTKAGKGTKFWIMTIAIVIGSLAVIGGGLKWLLGIIGFAYIK